MALKKLAVVVSGWHYPMNFYETLAKQTIPKGWTVDLFVVSHRDPSFAKMPEFEDSLRGELDKKLYSSIATIKDLENLGFDYKEYPNTIGDWGNSNQWLEEHNYEDYDLFLFTHDDNLLLRYDTFKIVCEEMFKENWLILTNTVGVPAGSIRGSFEFFKKAMMKKLGGKFDLSETTMTREGQTDNPKDWKELYDWNSTVYPLTNFLRKKKLMEKVIVFSPIYRVSIFCIEGERGLIANSQTNNKPLEDEGIKWLQENKII